MKLALSMYSYFRAFKSGELDFGGFLREAGNLDVDGVEIVSAMLGSSTPEVSHLLDLLESAALVCPIFSVSPNFVKSERSDREVETRKVTSGVDSAVRLNSEVIRVFAGDVNGSASFSDAREWIVEGLVESAVYAAEHGRRIALENHGKLAGTGAQVRELISEVRHRSGTQAIGANPDFGNFLLVDEPCDEGVAQVADLAFMAHLKDFKPEPNDHSGFAFESLAGRRYVGAVVSEGIVPLEACLGKLKDHGFDGWVSIEYEGVEDPSTGVGRCVQNSRRLLTH